MASITKADLLKLQKKYKRDAAIGEQFGITRQAVHQLRKKYGIGSIIEENPERNTEILAMYEGGKTVAAIAKKYDLSISYTYRIISEIKGVSKKSAAKGAPKKAAKKTAGVKKAAASKKAAAPKVEAAPAAPVKAPKAAKKAAASKKAPAEKKSSAVKAPAAKKAAAPKAAGKKAAKKSAAKK
jgi:hypothetical protein